jgi:urease subunit gamma/beta
MHLSPRELDKLTLHQAGSLAQKRLARGLRLNHPESVALIATVLLEMIRDGRSVAELMNLGRQFLGRRQVMAGVPDLITEVQVEGTFPDGSKLVTVHHPIAATDGNLALALHGSFLPVPDLAVFGSAPSDTEAEATLVPGAVEAQPGELEMNAGRPALELPVTNLGDRPIQVGSHYHFIETNASLQFDRDQAYGRRLDIPAGTAVRFEPGETRTVRLVAIAGRGIITGGNNLASGKIGAPGRRAAAKRVRARKFAHAPMAKSGS